MNATKETPAVKPRNRWLRVYEAGAVLALNTTVTFVVLNLVVAGVFLVVDTLSTPRNAVEEKYGVGALAAAYPGMSEVDIRTLLNESWQQRQVFRPYVHFREQPFRGKFVNIHEAGFRLSANQAPWPPPADAFSVFFFGGSTTFAYGLPDGDSVPSQVQQVLMERGVSNVAVYNFGAGAYQSTQERIYFGELLARGLRPDLAIFVDGLNDFAFPHVPQGTALVEQVLSGSTGPRALMTRVAGVLPLARLAQAVLPAAPAALDRAADNEPAAQRALIESVAIRYLSNVVQIGGAARAAGIAPVFVWQPTPYHRFDRRLHPFFDSGGANRHAEAGYAYMRTLVESRVIDPMFFWGADIQSDLKAPLYVDSVHYSASMSRHFAMWITDQLAAAGVLPPER